MYAQILGTEPRSALIEARSNGRLWFPPAAARLESELNTPPMLSTWGVRVEVGREEAGVESLERSLKSVFWPCGRVSPELWYEMNLLTGADGRWWGGQWDNQLGSSALLLAFELVNTTELTSTSVVGSPMEI